MEHFLTDIGIAVITATTAGYLAYRLGQPIILAYFLAGVIIGPEIGPPLIVDHENIDIISEIGLILLLFIIGLEIKPDKILVLVRRLIIPGPGQFALTAVILSGVFYLISGFLPFHKLEILYLAIGASLSSTAIVIKMLHDKYELDSIAGRVSLGILIFQDIWAILVIVLQPNFQNPSLLPVVGALLKGLALVIGGLLSSRYFLKYIYESIPRSPEMIVTVSIGWAAAFAGVAHAIGLSMEMGALIAGISIASFPHSEYVTLKIQPLRDFFLTLFFISLGMKIVTPGPELLYLVPMVIGGVILSRFLILYPLLRMSGTGPRNAFIASLNLSQMSEFSLVITSIGISLGHVTPWFMSVMIYSMAISAILSSYFIRYNNRIYSILSSIIHLLKGSEELEASKESELREIFILGYHRGARALVDAISMEIPEFLHRIKIIDFNQEVVRDLQSKSIACEYGDISNMEALEHAGIKHAKIIVSTIPDLLLRGVDGAGLVRMCRKMNPEAHIIASADLQHQIEPVKKSGATTVLQPYSIVATEMTWMLQKILGHLPDESRPV